MQRWWWKAAHAAGLGILICLAACSHEVYHEVRRGENLFRISKAYGVSADVLATVNHLSSPSHLEVGQRLLIPGATRELPVDLITPHAANPQRPEPREGSSASLEFSWPIVGGIVTSGFGERGHSFHDGIDISAPVGTPVHAAQDGEVIYSATLSAYGNVIIVRHDRGFATVYAHNHANRVHEGQSVRKGEIIASVGDSGRAAGANLHFEVRQDNVARDPLYFLPPLEQGNKKSDKLQASS